MLSAPGLLALLGLGCAAGAQKLTDAPTPENYYRRGTVSGSLLVWQIMECSAEF